LAVSPYVLTEVIISLFSIFYTKKGISSIFLKKMYSIHSFPYNEKAFKIKAFGISSA